MSPAARRATPAVLPCALVRPIPDSPQYVWVTPEIALDWLQDRNNRQQRPLSVYVAARYAQEMLAGNWKATHQGIAFDTDGYLIDGQHRLKAIAMSGVCVNLFVFTDCDPETFAVLDSGFRRQAAHLLKGAHRVPRAAAARTLAVVGPPIVELSATHARVYDGSLPTSAVLEVEAAWPELEQFAARCRNVYVRAKIHLPMHLAVVAQAARTQYAHRLPDWFERLSSGANLEADDPCLLLRNRYLRESKSLTTARDTSYNLIVRAWNAHARERPMIQLKTPQDNEGVLKVIS